MYKEVKRDWYKHLDFIIADIIGLQIAYILAYMIRHGASLPYEKSVYLVMGVILALLSMCSILFMENHKNILKRGNLVELKAVITYVTTISIVASFIMFLEKSLRVFSRAVFVQTWGIGIVLLYLIRITLKKIIRAKMVQTRSKRSVIVITTKGLLKDIMGKVSSQEYVDFMITGAILIDSDQRGKTIAEIPVVASKEDAIEYLTRNVVDEVFINVPRQMPLPDDIMDACMEMGITVHLNLLKVSDAFANKVVEKFGRYTVITSSLKMASPKDLLIKRALDICGGVVGVVITGIITIFVAPIIFLQSPGPIFFSQERVGKNGRKFKIYKFRSMYLDAEARKTELLAQNEMQGLMFKMKDDPRIFPFGHFLRNNSIDEFPQLLNVLKGDMSLVGTRPPTVDEYEQYDMHHRKRLATKPGLTGMWQVSGRSDITNFEEVVELDAKYITEWSIGLDLKILWKTVGVVFGKKGAV